MPNRTVFFVSDGTGITAETFGNSILAQFAAKPRHVRRPFIDSEEKADKVVSEINATADFEGKRPIVFITLANESVRAILVLCSIVIIGREIAISALREWMAEIGQRGKVKVSNLAKLKTIVQIVGLSCMLFRWNLPILPGVSLPVFEIGFALTIIAAALTLISAVSYLRAAWPELRGSS